MNNGSNKSEHMELLPVQVVAEVPRHDGDLARHQQQVNPAVAVHRLLRGRYHWLVLVAMIGCSLGLVAANMAYTPKYRSTGTIQIKPHIPHILYQTDLTGVMPAFNAFVEQQASLMRDQRVIDLAMQSPDWQAVGRGSTPGAIAAFMGSLDVRVAGHSAMIRVSFIDEDPATAMTAVRAVIDAYQSLYGNNDSDRFLERMQILDERRVNLQSELKSLNERIHAVAHEFGTRTLEQMHEFKIDQVHKLERELRDLQLASAIAEAHADGEAPQMEELTPERLASSDPTMRDYLREQQALQRRLTLDGYYFGENHSRMIHIRRVLENLNESIANRAEELREMYQQGGLPGLGMGVPALRRREQRVRMMYDLVRQEMLELGRTNLLLQSLETDAELVQRRLEETRARIEQLSVESAASGRVEIISKGDRPLLPHRDRRKSLLALGGAGGAGLGAAAVLLLGLVNQRLRSMEDARVGLGPTARVLGVLPALGDAPGDPEQLGTAAHCVHHIRTMLQMQDSKHGRKVIAITSPAPGDGKTTLAAALGVSFAAAKARTLLIDCDLVGGGLSARMSVRVPRKLGQVLVRQGVITQEQLREAMAHTSAGILDMANAGKHLGQILIRLGYLSERELSTALELQGTDLVGVLEALAGEPLEDCIAETAVPGLSILPLGRACAAHTAQLSPTALNAVLDEARRQFDVVLIDTGPVLGSLEASVVASAADDVVLAVARGTPRALAARSVQFLHELGAGTVSMVFNRADTKDVARSGMSSVRSARAVPEPHAGALERLPRLGPIATAVISSTSIDDDRS